MRQNKQIVESSGAPNENEIWLDDELNLKSYKGGKWNELTSKPVPQVQADWNQADTNKADYIKNKPAGIVLSQDITGMVVCTAAEYELIDPKVATVLYVITPDLP